ncbi:copper chaperone PCu(A)C [Celeribacter baekdonensis]|uniref:copper chaperone PCu(A)C n=1 Tax=Celeribacter baekdonensis TaxID=875171 RepID=UPI003A907F66
MFFKTTLLAGAAALSLALPAMADITIEDAYARSSGMMAKSGAAFFVIHNTGDTDDRLIAATSDIAKLTELHTHKAMGDGVMKMMRVDEGFAVPAQGTHALARGGDHVMLMGLLKPMGQGDVVTVTLTFEQAGDITVEIPVDLERQDAPAVMTMPMDGTGMQQGKMGN